VLKDFFNDIRLVNEADDSHLSFTLGAGKRIGFIGFPDKMGPSFFNSRAIIDATRPFEWLQEFPPVAKSSRELRERLLRRWGKLLFGV